MTPRRKDSGFAMLLVLLMAAVVAITLYEEIPRVAFDAQRQKEQLLLDRGDQFKRAIYLFYRDQHRYPATMDDLVTFQNKHYLRHKYIDPMTGKDEWRLIHTNGGVLTDSLTVQPPGQGQQQQQAAALTGYVGQQQGLVGAQPPPDGQTMKNLALRRRPNEGGANPAGTPGDTPSNDTQLPATAPPGSGQPVNTAGLPPGVAGTPGVPGGAPAFPGQPIQLQPGQQQGGQQQPGQQQSAAGGGGYVGGSGSYIGGGSATPTNTPQQQFPARLTQPPGFVPDIGYVQQPNSGQNQAGANQASNMINQILTNPRPGGMAGLGLMQGGGGAAGGGGGGFAGGGAAGGGGGFGGGASPFGTSVAGPQGQVMGGGIAGVASKADEEGIMVYNDRTNYKEWEFIFDPAKWKAPADPRGGGGGTPASQLGTQPGTPVSPTSPTGPTIPRQ